MRLSNMNHLKWSLLGVVLLLSACAILPKRATRVALEIEADNTMNPTVGGRPSPVELRIYQLKSAAAFNDADFFSLYENAESVLGRDLVDEEKVVLKPLDTLQRKFEMPKDANTIGIFAAFRDYERARWKVDAVVRPRRSTVIRIQVSGTTLEIQ